jgi:O-antigen ligase
VVEIFAIMLVFAALPGTAARYTENFIRGVTDFETSVWLHTINGGLYLAKDNLLFGIGPGNFRFLSYELLGSVPFTRPDNHPHNYYSQMLCETGIIGLILGTVFLWSIIWTCFRASFKNRENVFIATAWVIPFGLFWPIATSADFFGQWNNIFMWSAVAVAITANEQYNFKSRQ